MRPGDNNECLGIPRYCLLGECRNSQGNLGTDKLFTGQRLDDTGLYYYGARYYDASIGRFISADPIVSSYTNPQSFNRYSYVLNNPLKYVDPLGLDVVGLMQIADETYFVHEVEGKYRAENVMDETKTGWYDTLEDLQDAAGGYYEQQHGGVGGYEDREFDDDEKARFERNLINTRLGLDRARKSGDVTTRLALNNTIIVEGIDNDSPTGQLMIKVLDAPAFCLGHVVLARKSRISQDTEAHELGHVEQGDILGVVYLPAHFVGWSSGVLIARSFDSLKVHKYNFMEHWLIP